MMDGIALLGRNDRRDLFTEAGVRTGLPPFHVEKDFWVCWTLANLFGSENVGPYLTFRGGTSLSKAWGIIKRFSEDIDLAMKRKWFPDLKEPADAGITSSERERRLKGLREECRHAIERELCPVLVKAIGGLKEGARIEVEQLEKARDPFCVYVHYPSAGFESPAAYNRAVVKIELSGRADGWPMVDRQIMPYAAIEFPDIDPAAKCRVSCVRPERTFLEKAALIHEQNTRPGDSPLAPRQARHLYDIVELWRTVAQVKGICELWSGVIAHRKSYYAYKWVDYEGLLLDAIQLVPPKSRLSEWRADYREMRSMFHEEPPRFDELIGALGEVETGLDNI